MKHKVSDLEGALLDAAVAKAEGKPYVPTVMPSSVWEDGGPIIQRDRISVVASRGFGPDDGPIEWSASVGAFSHYIDEPLPMTSYNNTDHCASGPTPLIAAMRAFCASRFGDEVELP